MEVPAPSSGTVKEIRVKVGDKVGEGVTILTMEGGEAGAVDRIDVVSRQYEAP